MLDTRSFSFLYNSSIFVMVSANYYSSESTLFYKEDALKAISEEQFINSLKATIKLPRYSMALSIPETSVLGCSGFNVLQCKYFKVLLLIYFFILRFPSLYLWLLLAFSLFYLYIVIFTFRIINSL